MKMSRMSLLVIIILAILGSLSAQESPALAAATAQITGTVTDVNGDAVAGATVLLHGANLQQPLKILSDDNGFFDFKQLDPGTYRVTVTAQDFANWDSSDLVLTAGQYIIVSDCKLRVAQVTSSVNVVYTPEEVALEEVKLEETQRAFGFIPNFYVVYDAHPAPLTAKLKFHLAFRTSTDVVTVLGVGALAGINQAGDTPNYQQGAKGYGERFGAVAADGFSDIMIGGAILPSLLRQDPRYYYRGTGTNSSRIFHAISSPFICRGDNGKLQPNYSSVGGDLASSALSNLYYPASNRGTGLIFQNFAVTTGERMLSSLVQEFVLNRVTGKRLRN